MGKISEHDKKMNKRLLLATPAALLIIILILLGMEETNVVENAFTVGYEGPLELVPEISIIDESDIESDRSSVQRDAMIAQNVVLDSEDMDKSENPDDITSRLIQAEPDNRLPYETDGRYLYRTHPSKENAPYREDYVILKMVEPIYPIEALLRRQEGYVIVEVYVNEEGAVSGAWVRSAFGPESFEQASLDAVWQFLFKPVIENGKPVPFWISFLIRFKYRS
jgi:TonB family protein